MKRLVEGNTKQCTTCKLVLSIKSFSTRKNRPSRVAICKSCNRQRGQAWYQSNKEKRSKSVRRYKESHLAIYESYNKLYRLANRPLFNEYTRKYRARKIAATIEYFTLEALNQRMGILGLECIYCKGPFEEIDHAIPLSREGLHILANLRPSCVSCNRSKNNKTISEFEFYKTTLDFVK